MPFAIKFLDDAPLEHLLDDDKIPAARGLLLLGDYEEEFVSGLLDWDQAAYRRQWKVATEKILRGAQKTAFLVHFINPASSSYCEVWEFYRSHQTFYVQNQVLFYDQLFRTFSPDNVDDFIRDRVTLTNTGRKISEWSVSLEDIQAFAETMPW